MCEALYLYGVILLLLDRKIPGPTREKMVIAFYRSKGESALENIDEVCKLCRVTGYLPGQPKPPQYPERYFKRFAPPEEVVSMVIGKLQSDDIYLQEPSFPHRNHRSTRLAAQASMLFVILFFAPDILIHEKATMREIVDRHFNDNFILTTYMGAVADLSLEWAAYPAARLALAKHAGASEHRTHHTQERRTDAKVDRRAQLFPHGRRAHRSIRARELGSTAQLYPSRERDDPLDVSPQPHAACNSDDEQLTRAAGCV
ncbi:hypothetical protein PINS_up003658 [Pythium insidiosum]|nr:hypothetical protein PINS_up003658 [Pythium insidiosum]